MGFLEKLTETIYLDYVLKVGGVILLAVVLFNVWGRTTGFQKFGLIAAPVMWFVGARFNKLYR